MAEPYPLQFEPILKEKVWGGDRLVRLGKRLSAGARVGESWEIADLATTAASGGGGDAARSVIVNGELAGKTLHDAMALWGEDLLGPAARSGDGGFPLLVKFLDAQENLSVQVHPPIEYAKAHPGAHVKTEAWVVVDAEPGSVIYAGLRDGVTRGELESVLRSDARERVVDLLCRVEARAGECHLLPSGTVHALGAGVMVLEVQTASDTTFRVFDWEREKTEPRALHVEEALACARLGPAPKPVAFGGVCRTEWFEIRSFERAVDLGWGAGRAIGVVCLDGGCTIAGDGWSEKIGAGGVVLIPAACEASVRGGRVVCFAVR